MCFALYLMAMLFLAVILAGYIHVYKTDNLPRGKELVAWGIVCLVVAPFLPFVIPAVLFIWAIVEIIEILD